MIADLLDIAVCFFIIAVVFAENPNSTHQEAGDALGLHQGTVSRHVQTINAQFWEAERKRQQRKAK